MSAQLSYTMRTDAVSNKLEATVNALRSLAATANGHGDPGLAEDALQGARFFEQLLERHLADLAATHVAQQVLDVA